MTEEEAKKLVVGDRVLVEMEVKSPLVSDGYVRVVGRDGEHGYFIPHSIVREVLPRPLAVGDRVMWCAEVGVIRLIEGKAAAVLLEDGEPCVFSLLRNLTRLPADHSEEAK